MDLRSYEGKNVRIIDIDEEIFEGYAADYIFAEDNAPEEVEALVLEDVVRKSDGYKYENLIEFTAPEIKSIKAL